MSELSHNVPSDAEDDWESTGLDGGPTLYPTAKRRKGIRASYGKSVKVKQERRRALRNGNDAREKQSIGDTRPPSCNRPPAAAAAAQAASSPTGSELVVHVKNDGSHPVPAASSSQKTPAATMHLPSAPKQGGDAGVSSHDDGATGRTVVWTPPGSTSPSVKSLKRSGDGAGRNAKSIGTAGVLSPRNPGRSPCAELHSPVPSSIGGRSPVRSSSARPPPVVPAPGAENKTSLNVGKAPAAEQPAETAEKKAPVAEQPAETAEKKAPVAEQPAETAEKTPVAEQPAETAEKAPAAEKASPTAAKPGKLPLYLRCPYLPPEAVDALFGDDPVLERLREITPCCVPIEELPEEDQKRTSTYISDLGVQKQRGYKSLFVYGKPGDSNKKRAKLRMVEELDTQMRDMKGPGHLAADFVAKNIDCDAEQMTFGCLHCGQEDLPYEQRNGKGGCDYATIGEHVIGTGWNKGVIKEYVSGCLFRFSDCPSCGMTYEDAKKVPGARNSNKMLVEGHDYNGFANHKGCCRIGDNIKLLQSKVDKAKAKGLGTSNIAPSTDKKLYSFITKATGMAEDHGRYNPLVGGQRARLEPLLKHLTYGKKSARKCFKFVKRS